MHLLLFEPPPRAGWTIVEHDHSTAKLPVLHERLFLCFRYEEMCGSVATAHSFQPGHRTAISGRGNGSVDGNAPCRQPDNRMFRAESKRQDGASGVVPVNDEPDMAREAEKLDHGERRNCGWVLCDRRHIPSARLSLRVLVSGRTCTSTQPGRGSMCFIKTHSSQTVVQTIFRAARRRKIGFGAEAGMDDAKNPGGEMSCFLRCVLRESSSGSGVPRRPSGRQTRPINNDLIGGPTEIPNQMDGPTPLEEAHRMATRPRTPGHVTQHDDGDRLEGRRRARGVEEPDKVDERVAE